MPSETVKVMVSEPCQLVGVGEMVTFRFVLVIMRLVGAECDQINLSSEWSSSFTVLSKLIIVKLVSSLVLLSDS